MSWSRRGKDLLEKANRALVDAAYRKAAVRVEGRVALMRAEADAESVRQAEQLPERISALIDRGAGAQVAGTATMDLPPLLQLITIPGPPQ